MNHRTVPIILFGLLIASCNQNENIAFNVENLTENDLEICADIQCPEITINYVKVRGNDGIAKKINEKIDYFIISSIEFGEDAQIIAKTITEAATDFAKSYHTDKNEFPDMVAPYVAEVSVKELYRSDDHISLELSQYLFTGGAHGYGSTSFLNVDPETGEELGFNELFIDHKAFLAFAEGKFREQQKISPQQSINDHGFWFENDIFYLPNSFGFTADSIIFIYNQYDIASYADGPIELKISRKEAAPYLIQN